MELNCKYHYKAFTLWEMMITLLITSLIVSMSYGVYSTFTHVLKNDQEILNSQSEMMILEKQLYGLVDSCVSIELIDEVLYFNFKDDYSYMEFDDSTMFWAKDPSEDELIYQMEDWSAEFLDKQTDYIRRFQLSILSGDLTYKFYLKKIYSRAMLYAIKKE